MRSTYSICAACAGRGCQTCSEAGAIRAPEFGDPTGAEPMRLPDDPAAALRLLGHYLSDIRIERGRTVKDGTYLVGYWQTEEYTEGLLDLGMEALRVAKVAGQPIHVVDDGPPPDDQRVYRLLAHSVDHIANGGAEGRAYRLFPYLLAAFLVAVCFALVVVFHLTIHQHLP